MYKRFLISTLLLIGAFTVKAQIYPVQATTQLMPPYSLYLSDYVSPGSERLALNIFLGDVTRPELNVRLRLKIVGQSVTIETKPEYVGPRLTLQGGVPLRLISSDLADYFNPANLNFQGITQRQYEQRGKLPEGVYQLCFEVLEYNRGVKISNTACAVAWMVLNDPPLINMPRQNEKLRPQIPQNVVIQWTPRHTGSPNSAFSTEYELEMVEVWPSDRNPNDAILSSPRILTTTTQSTTYIYGPSEVQLEPGRRYAFRVRAKAIAGIDELDLFKNNGYSEVYSFVYGDACTVPGNILASTLSSTRIGVEWEAQQNHSGFKVNYREAGTSTWYTNTSVVSDVTINSLKPSTTYEYQVAATCGAFNGTFSEIARIRTKDKPASDYSCGLPMENFNLDPSQLTGSIKVGDIINAGDFDVQVTKVTGSGGVFTGEGVVVMPMMNKVKVKVSFDNITVANDGGNYRMVKGYMDVTGGGVDVVPEGVTNFMDQLVETMDAVDSALDAVKKYIPKQGPDPVSFAADTLMQIDGDVLAVVRDPDSGHVIITTTNGQITELPSGQTYAVTDKKGKGYLVDSNGGITRTTADNAVKASKREYNLKISFAEAPNTIHGFDKKSIDVLAYTYEKLGDSYYVPWKAVPANSLDYAKGLLEDNSLDATKVYFEKDVVSAIISSPSNREWTITSNTMMAGETGSITAFYPPKDSTDKEQVLGKLNVAGYNSNDFNVVIVPVNGAPNPFGSATELEGQLNDIYKQAVVQWRVSYDAGINVTFDKPFDAGDSELLSNYTGDMKKVINAYGRMQENTYYLFLIVQTDNIKNEGYMPRSKQAGFIFVTSNMPKDAIVKTMAHELGHGAFALRHPFKEFEGSISERTTDNLMDYKPDGRKLLKYQWDRIHDPVTVLGLFEDDEEAEYKSWTALAGDVIPQFPGYENRPKGFLAPTGSAILLGADARDFTFSNGYLVAFTIGDERYVGLQKKNSNEFVGYYYDATKDLNGNYNTGKSAGGKYVGLAPTDTDGNVEIFYALKGRSCDEFTTYRAKLVNDVVSLDGGITKSTRFHTDNDITTILKLSDRVKISLLQVRSNCLEGRAKEFVKFVMEYFNKHAPELLASYVSEYPDSNFENDLISQILIWGKVHVKKLDGEVPPGQYTVREVRIREMLKYGPLEFLAKLKELNAGLTEAETILPRTLVVEFEDYNNIRDIYLAYKIKKEFDPDCTIAEDLFEEIDRQLNEKGEVEFNWDFFKAVVQSSYEMAVGNETLELVLCLLKQLRASEAIYNPNRIDFRYKEIYDFIFKEYLHLDTNGIARQIVEDLNNYPMACSCGVWNSLLDIVIGIGELGTGISDDPFDLFNKLGDIFSQVTSWDGLKAMGSGMWGMIKDHHGYVEGYGFDSYQATYGTCYDVVFVASLFIGVGELEAIGKAGDLGEVARIILRAAKAYPKNVVVSFRDLVIVAGKLSSKAARNTILEIFERLPNKLVAELPDIANVIILKVAIDEGVSLVSFSEEGMRILAQTEAVNRGKNIIYESGETLTDLNSGKTGKLVFVDEGGGKITAYIDDLAGGITLLDRNALTNLKAEVPNGTFINSKKFENSALKIDPPANSKLKQLANDIKVNGDVDVPGGSKTEEIMNILYKDAGYESLNGKVGGNQGLDGLYIKGGTKNPTEILIGEAKQWSSSGGGVSVSPANPSTGLPVQMSDRWIDNVANRIRDDASRIADPVLKQQKLDIANMLLDPNNLAKIEKYLIVVNKSTGEINILKLGTY